MRAEVRHRWWRPSIEATQPCLARFLPKTICHSLLSSSHIVQMCIPVKLTVVLCHLSRSELSSGACRRLCTIGRLIGLAIGCRRRFRLQEVTSLVLWFVSCRITTRVRLLVHPIRAGEWQGLCFLSSVYIDTYLLFHWNQNNLFLLRGHKKCRDEKFKFASFMTRSRFKLAVDQLPFL